MNIKELNKKICLICEGSGVVQTPEWREYWEQKKHNHDIEMPMHVPEEEICKECEGEGVVLEIDKYKLKEYRKKRKGDIEIITGFDLVVEENTKKIVIATIYDVEKFNEFVKVYEKDII